MNSNADLLSLRAEEKRIFSCASSLLSRSFAEAADNAGVGITSGGVGGGGGGGGEGQDGHGSGAEDDDDNDNFAFSGNQYVGGRSDKTAATAKVSC